MSDGETLQVPSGVSATATGPGVTRVEFAGQGGESRYEIWRRHGDTVDWYLHATVEVSSFEDASVKPGQYYEYKVRAVRGESASGFSPSAVVYGA